MEKMTKLEIGILEKLHTKREKAKMIDITNTVYIMMMEVENTSWTTKI